MREIILRLTINCELKMLETLRMQRNLRVNDYLNCVDRLAEARRELRALEGK